MPPASGFSRAPANQHGGHHRAQFVEERGWSRCCKASHGRAPQLYRDAYRLTGRRYPIVMALVSDEEPDRSLRMCVTDLLSRVIGGTTWVSRILKWSGASWLGHIHGMKPTPLSLRARRYGRWPARRLRAAVQDPTQSAGYRPCRSVCAARLISNKCRAPEGRTCDRCLGSQHCPTRRSRSA